MNGTIRGMDMRNCVANHRRQAMREVEMKEEAKICPNCDTQMEFQGDVYICLKCGEVYDEDDIEQEAFDNGPFGVGA